MPEPHNERLPVTIEQEALSPLPFTYQRTEDPNATEYKQWRVSPVRFGGKDNEPYTAEQIIEMVRQQKEAEQWYTLEHWRKKGVSQEQIEFTINGQQVSVYNFSEEKPITDEHLQRAQSVFQEMASRFPQAMRQIRWIMIENEQLPSAFGDPEKYPTNGMAYKNWNAFQFFPRGTELFPYRLPAVSNFEGVFSHELTHLIQSEFEAEWAEKFNWAYCWDYEDEWEVRSTPDGTMKRWFNKATGEMSPQGQFSLQPDHCVTYYARQKMSEDICESMVAYIYDPEFLKTVAPEKYEILSRHDAKLEKPEVSSRRVPKDEIALPTIKPETVLYHIQEPTNEEST